MMQDFAAASTLNDGWSRRRVLASIAAFGAGAICPIAAPLAQTPAPNSRRIDVHHHFFAPPYKEAWQEWNARAGQGPLLPFVANWTPERTLEEFDKNGVSTGILSLPSTPPVWFGLDAAGMRRMARECNDYAARVMADHPGRFGLFAALPLPDVEGSLREIEYAFDTLHADGVGITTSYGDKWPGDPVYKPVFEELNRRKAVVYFHPLAPYCCGNLMPDVDESLVEFPHDTTRAVLSLLFSGTLERLRDIRFVFSHAGGTVPMLAGRIETLSKFNPKTAKVAPNGIDYELKRLHYETANSAYPPTMAALLKFVPVSQVMFGSDFPYVSIGQNLAGLHSLGLSTADLAAIESGNVERLIPRLKA